MNAFSVRRCPHASILVGIIALSLLPVPTWAQANDIAYCVELGDLVRRYVASSGGNGDIRPNFAIREAIDDCNKGNTEAGIQVLERTLRSHDFTLPRRTAPA